ncbi:13460_t:CDS:2 [Gigaspora margarita]|uniref:13460_t:CDS:1 n=1 Tax=Gigaspora margarita TaxID=4874 RepID=A0ABN7X9T4_GIGMA|nr:13460_t:CDS:2 [Gigaspora margarita]
MKNNSEGQNNKELDQQIVKNERLIKNGEKVSLSEVQEQVNKSQALMKEFNSSVSSTKDNKGGNGSLPYVIGGSVVVAAVEDPNYQREINRSLPPNATSLQVAKYKLCKQMLIYQQEHNLSDEEIAKKIKLSVAEVEDILFCEIEKFTLDRLISYAEKLFSRNGISVVIEPKKDNLHARVV